MALRISVLSWIAVCLLALPGAICQRSLHGVTYAPFALDLENICLPPDQVKTDMELVGSVAERVRIYNIAICPENTRIIMEYCKDNGLNVLLGLWISNDSEGNQREFDMLPEIMDSYSNIIEAVVVGNEAVFIQEVDAELVVEYVDKARTMLRASGYEHPVSTAEVWPIYESEVGQMIADASDFICMNMQPYWEGWDVFCQSGDPLEVCSPAGTYVNLKSDGLSQLFGKDVWICETGWPTDGERCCSGERDNAQAGFKAVPSIENATRFVANLVEESDGRDRPYFLHSIIDDDWKRIWDPCDECKGKQVIKFADGQCDLCEVDYHWGIYTFERERKQGYTLPAQSTGAPTDASQDFSSSATQSTPAGVQSTSADTSALPVNQDDAEDADPSSK